MGEEPRLRMGDPGWCPPKLAGPGSPALEHPCCLARGSPLLPFPYLPSPPSASSSSSDWWGCDLQLQQGEGLLVREPGLVPSLHGKGLPVEGGALPSCLCPGFWQLLGLTLGPPTSGAVGPARAEHSAALACCRLCRCSTGEASEAGAQGGRERGDRALRLRP